MELEGLKRCLSKIETAGLEIDTLVTDRHVQVRSYMDKSKASIKHRFDCWHLAKGKECLHIIWCDMDCTARVWSCLTLMDEL